MRNFTTIISSTKVFTTIKVDTTSIYFSKVPTFTTSEKQSTSYTTSSIHQSTIVNITSSTNYLPSLSISSEPAISTFTILTTSKTQSTSFIPTLFSTLRPDTSQVITTTLIIGSTGMKHKLNKVSHKWHSI